MDIVEFKKKLENNKLEDTFFIFVLKSDNEDFEKYFNDIPSSSIVSDQYIKRICELKHLRRKDIDSLSEIPDDSFITDDNLYVITTNDEWTSTERHDNCIIVCKSTKEDHIKIPVLQEWQLIDYVIPILKGLQKSEIEDFIKRYTTSHGTNYRRFLKDVEKLSSFEPSLQSLMYHQMLDSGELDTATNLTIFDLTDSIMKRDKVKVSKILDKLKYVKEGTCKNDYYIDIEPLGLWTLLYKKFKTLLMIKSNPHCSYEEVGCKSDKQLWYIRTYESGYYTIEEVEKILELLTNIEYMYKLGGLDLNQLIDYLVVKILGGGI